MLLVLDNIQRTFKLKRTVSSEGSAKEAWKHS